MTATQHTARPSPAQQLDCLLDEARTQTIRITAALAADYGSKASLKFARIGAFTLSTDEAGDYLRVARDGGEPVTFMHVREFSLHGRDLSTVKGRAQVREYVRRKLQALRSAAA